jgi:hypothetical protein
VSPLQTVYPFQLRLPNNMNFCCQYIEVEGSEESGSSPTCRQKEKDDSALKEALDLLRGTIADAAFPPNPIR